MKNTRDTRYTVFVYSDGSRSGQDGGVVQWRNSAGRKVGELQTALQGRNVSVRHEEGGRGGKSQLVERAAGSGFASLWRPAAPSNAAGFRCSAAAALVDARVLAGGDAALPRQGLRDRPLGHGRHGGALALVRLQLQLKKSVRGLVPG